MKIGASFSHGNMTAFKRVDHLVVSPESCMPGGHGTNCSGRGRLLFGLTLYSTPRYIHHRLPQVFHALKPFEQAPVVDEIVMMSFSDLLWWLLRTGCLELNREFEFRRTLLHMAAHHRNEAIVNMLSVFPGVNLEAREQLYGQTPLMVAVQRDNLEIVRMLVIAGADVHAVDRDNLSVLALCRTVELAQFIQTAQQL